MIIIIRALPQWGKDDGDYDSPISRDETPDGKKEKKRERPKKEKAQKKRKAKKSPKKKKKGQIKKEKAQKKERKREKGQCYYPFTTLVLQSSTMFFI